MMAYLLFVSVIFSFSDAISADKSKNLRSMEKEVVIKDCGLCRNVFQKHTHELDFTAKFSQTDGDFEMGQQPVYNAMKYALNDQILLNETKIVDLISASNKYFVGIDHMYATPDRDPGIMSTEPAPIFNMYYFFENTELDIQFAYDCCGDMDLLTTEVFDAVVSSLIDEKDALASEFEKKLVVPSNWTYQSLYWNL
mmetsp:Transcript_4195/g.6206  ORF Transcript_4195/g.6206 Transcript_4195/m.6206 type:complete len:196 (+) Transcript_4195:121-708(+)